MPLDANPMPDLGAVGNAARGSKAATGGKQQLQSFSVKRGDNGGVLVCETYEMQAPEGRRAQNFGGGDYKENPFGPDDGPKASRYIAGLMGQMSPGLAPAPAEPPTPRVAAVSPSRVTVAAPGAVASAPRPMPRPMPRPPSPY